MGRNDPPFSFFWRPFSEGFSEKKRGNKKGAEQGLEDKETCALAEIFLPNINSYEEFVSLLKLIYRGVKHSLLLPCHQEATEEVVHRNMRMGIGLTGILQCSKEQMSWLDPAYKELRAFDKYYSEKLGIPVSIKLTTIKPSGTMSLLPGVTPGAHPAFAQYLIRRMRISSNHPIVQVCRDHGYHVEYQENFDGSKDFSTVVVSFPMSYPPGTRLAEEMTAIDQLEVIKFLQKNWSDNSVSCTVYYSLEELPGVIEYLNKNYKDNFKTLSFLLKENHGFKQAPLEKITKEQYREMVQKVKPIDHIDSFLTDLDDADCAGGACPIR